MKYILSRPNQFRQVNDPYGHNRICFEQIGHHGQLVLDRADLLNIANDGRLIGIFNNIIYFEQ